VELQGRLEELKSSGIGVAAISYDSPEVLAAFASERGISYPLLSDKDSAVITAFGILNTVAVEGMGPDQDDPDVDAAVRKYVGLGGAFAEAIGTPFPGTFMLDENGYVQSRFFEEFYRDRNTTASVMLKLGIGLSPVAAIEGSSDQLKFTAYPSNSVVTAGSRFSIAVDVEPNPGMHVYAPGAEKLRYRVVGLNLDPNPRLRYEPVEYPESEIYHFEPLDEYVPVYQQSFTLLQEVFVEASNEAEAVLAESDTLTLTGNFSYQACDDEICYNPASAPLSFTIDLAEY
jgi:AhpC/TSA family protein/cytochrome c biogenesis DsbD-like protein